jgi:hypothetical protein
LISHDEAYWWTDNVIPKNQTFIYRHFPRHFTAVEERRQVPSL